MDLNLYPHSDTTWTRSGHCTSDYILLSDASGTIASEKHTVVSKKALTVPSFQALAASGEGLPLTTDQAEVIRFMHRGTPNFKCTEWYNKVLSYFHAMAGLGFVPPRNSLFEICVGARLLQELNWRNVVGEAKEEIENAWSEHCEQVLRGCRFHDYALRGMEWIDARMDHLEAAGSASEEPRPPQPRRLWAGCL